MIKSVRDQLQDILEEYAEEAAETIDDVTKSVAEDTAKYLKRISPRSKDRGKHYASGWTVTSKKLSGVRVSTATVHNKTHYRLTHLLERPHDIRNQYGVYGRSTPQPHIAEAEQYGTDLYIKTLEAKL